NLLHFADATGDRDLEAAAWEAADLVADRLGAVDSVPRTSGGDHPYAGLLRGSSGPALLFLRLYERTGDTRLLDLAATALRQDLRRCVLRADGQLHVDEDWRTMPYLAQGSVGIGVVVDQYLTHRAHRDLATGTAGVLLSLGAARHDRPVDLPFLAPTTRPSHRGEGNTHHESGEEVSHHGASGPSGHARVGR